MPFQTQALPETTKLRTMQHIYLIVVAHEVFTVFVYGRPTWYCGLPYTNTEKT